VRRRFVVQRHTVQAGEVHFDLMIESDDRAVLVTFQLERPPGEPGAWGQRSFDHRLRYLDYEGEIGGDRGRVDLWDRGELSDVEGDPRGNHYLALFEGDRLTGPYELRERTDGRVRFVMSEAP
jgi:hypothetical protein